MIERVLAVIRANLIWVIAGVVAFVVVVTAAAVVLFRSEPHQTFTAEFLATPGLYTHNTVDILGVPTGSVTKVEPGQGVVRVTLSLPKSVKIPAEAHAILMAPNPVSERSVELYPPYTGGKTLADGAVIPLARTAAPLELDQIYANLDSLATSLGPSGANADGSVKDVLKSLARLASGNGTNLHETLVALANALPAFTSDPDRVAALVTSLDKLTKVLAQHDSSIDTLYGDLSSATKTLADERGMLGSAIANLQDALAQLTRFIQANKDAIGSNTRQLATTAQSILANQQALIDTFDTAALGFENFGNAVNLNAPCQTGPGKCPAINLRLTMPANVASIVANYCGPTIQNAGPILLNSVNKGSASTLNTLCVYESSTEQGVKPAPGAPAGPDLGLSRFLK